jgi:Holliday junction resolvasome RuvABC endonuclease subunit
MKNVKMVNPKNWGNKNLNGAVAVGIDQSYSGFGMTAIDDHNDYYTEVHKLEGTGVERLAKARIIVINFVLNFEVKAIAMEGYAFGSQMANMAGELGGVVKLALYEYFTEPELAYPLIVPPTSLKKYITGKGRVEKNQILLQVYKKWDVEFNNDNAADSYGLARIAANKHDFEYEKEVYDKLTSP